MRVASGGKRRGEGEVAGRGGRCTFIAVGYDALLAIEAMGRAVAWVWLEAHWCWW